jgi:hypothetical protein
MPAFPDNLYPADLDLFYKLLIYFGFIYIFITALTVRIITKRRINRTKLVKEKKQKTVDKSDKKPLFENKQDNLTSIQIELTGLEASLTALNDMKNDKTITSHVFKTLSTSLIATIGILSEKLPSREPEETSQSADLGADFDFDDELEKLLELDEEDDGFLKTPEIPEALSKPSVPKASLAPAPPEVTPKPSVPKASPVSAPPKTMPKPSVPKASLAPTPPKTMPKPSVPKASLAPTPPKAMPKPSMTIASPQAKVPRKPTTTESDEKMFAKSTSIAAIRMDMLRELARLKKLIKEDQDQ